MADVPKLEPFCNSWVAVDRKTGKPVYETFDPQVAGLINQDRYELLTTYQWLVRFNRQVKEGPSGA